ncbi:Ger(x)C family spore germination protein [Paenibacillus sp. YIM B09110]|uniref:Ger(x)C family spore germination protein n=1 Tax=Paenibacillus sp. YIM B09110 TaxID=3126102 RepID=UPI00301CC0A1
MNHRRRQRRSGAFIALLLSGILLTGCWDRTEINDLAIVLATGIDYVDDKVQLTSQIFIPRKGGNGAESGGSGQGGSSSGVTLIRTAEGSNIAEALNRLQRKVARNMFWGHCEVVVISEQAGKQGLREYIDFLLRYPQFREHAYVFSSSEPARELLALLDPLERSSAESLREMANMGLGTRVTVLKLAKSIEGPGQSAILSRMRVLPADPGQNRYTTTPYVKGLSLYKNGRYVNTVEEPLTVGVLLLANELNNLIMPLKMKDEKGSFSIRVIEMKAKLVPRIIDEVWNMQINIQAKGEVVLDTTDISLAESTRMDELERVWAERLENLANKALLLAQKKLKADLFDFSVAFRRRYPKQWKKQVHNWETRFSELDVKMDVQAHIVRTGKSIGPQGITGQDSD